MTRTERGFVVNVEIEPVNYKGRIPVRVSATLEVPLAKDDIVRWLDTVEDAETLRYISRYARRLAEAIESPVDDDFRSRA